VDHRALLIQVATTAELSEQQLAETRVVVENAFADHFDPTDWDHCLGGWHVIARDGDTVVAHAAVAGRTLEIGGRVYNSGYVEGVATAATHRHRGIGTQVMAVLNDIIRREFEVGALSTGAHEFYERLRWERWQGTTFIRARGRVVRTEDEDDGIMVLRFGSSREINLSAPITADERDGDDW